MKSEGYFIFTFCVLAKVSAWGLEMNCAKTSNLPKATVERKLTDEFIRAYLSVGQTSYGVMDLNAESMEKAKKIYLSQIDDSRTQLELIERKIAELKAQPSGSEHASTTSEAASLEALESSRQALSKQIEQYRQNIAAMESQYAHSLKNQPQTMGAHGKIAVTQEDRGRVEALVGKTASRLKKRKGFVDCGLTDAEIFTIYLYTDSIYLPLNQALRNDNREDIERFAILIRTLNQGLKKIATYNQTVRRGVALTKKEAAQYCNGCVITMKAFTSASASQYFGGSHQFLIKSKTGAYIAPLSKNVGEEEVLFRSGTKFKVLSSRKNEFVLEEIAR